MKSKSNCNSKIKISLGILIVALILTYGSYTIYNNIKFTNNSSNSNNNLEGEENKINVDYNIDFDNKDILIEKIVNYPQDSYDTNLANSIIETIQTIDIRILQAMYLNNSKIFFINDPVEDNIGGWTGNNEVYLPIVPGGANEWVALHELGHLVDHYLLATDASSTEYFLSIAENQHNLLFKQFGKVEYRGSNEHFADGFAYYYRNTALPISLKKDAPLTYNYINNIITNFNTFVKPNLIYNK